MPDTQISEEMVDAFIAAFNSGVFDRPAFNLPVDERCRCGQCLQEEADARSTVRAALEAALSGHVVVPRTISDSQLNKALGREEDARITPMFSMFRDFYHNIVAAPPVPEMKG